MSDKDEASHAREMLDKLREDVKPHLHAMVAGIRQFNTAAAELAGDPITSANERFWGITGNIFQAANAKLDPEGPEIARLVDLSKAITTASQYEDWASASAVCERLFDDLDGGEELGLSDDFRNVDWWDEMQRAAALRKGMGFHRVPRSYQVAVADVIAGLMLAMPDSWVMADTGHQLPQPWAQVCTYVVGAIAERVKAAQGAFH